MAPTPKLEKGSQPLPPLPPEGVAGRNAMVVVAVVVAGAALHWLGDLLTPLALAIFLMVMIESFTRLLKARFKFLPDWAALATALALLVAAFLLSAVAIYENAAGFIDQLAGYAPRLDALIASGWKFAGQRHPPTVNLLITQLHPAQYLGVAANGLRFVAPTGLVLIYLGFLIAARSGFHRKWVMLFPGHDERHKAVIVFEHMRFGVERYLWTQTVAGLLIATISWGIMMVAGLDNAFFWAFLIFLVGFIPIIGPMVGATIPAVFALGQFDSYVPAVVLLAALNSTHAAVGTLLLPRMQGKSLNLDPVVVLLSLAFWGQIWGLAGMFLATPLTVAVMVVLSQFHGSRWISILLSGDGDPLGEAKIHKKQTASEK